MQERYGYERRSRTGATGERPARRAVRQRRPQRAARRADDRGGRRRQARALREAARARRDRELRDVAEAARAGVQHMCGFNYRFVPAVRLAREIIEAGGLGEMSSTSAPPTCRAGAGRPTWTSGASTRRRPARVRSATSARTSSTSPATSSGDISTVSALVHTVVPGPPGRRRTSWRRSSSRNGAIGTLEASRLARGRPQRVQ